jgi:two-component system response regulator MtrA
MAPGMTARILLVEDDQRLGTQVADSLRQSGFEVIWRTRGDAVDEGDVQDTQLVVLDLMLPGAHGFDVLKRLRATANSVPVLVLSARQDTHDKVRAFELGADDYLSKPFWPEELLARVRARLRRPELATATRALDVGPLGIDRDARRVTVDGQVIDLTRAEFEILSTLARRPGAAVSRSALVTSALDPDRDGDERTLDVHVSRLRKKLGAAGRLIATVWGVGYRLATEPGPP